MQRRTTKAEANGRTDVPEEAKSVRLDDVLAFLRVYAKAAKPQVKDRANFTKLLSQGQEKEKLTTYISQMERIVDFLYGEGESDRTGLHKLFVKDNIGGLVPSEDARELHKHFVILRDVYRNIKTEIDRKRLDNPPPVLRVGASRTIGLRLLAAILSNRQRLFPRGVRLEVEIASSHDIINRLKSRLLDVVIAYGDPNAKPGKPDAQTGLEFRSLGYSSRMVLLCSPTDPLWMRAGNNNKVRDANKGYWETCYQRKSRRDLPLYENLRPIDLHEIEFTDTKLIVVDSLQQPKGLEAFLRRLPPPRLVVHVPWYEQALALVRMGQGVAVTTEVFSRRARITSFRLTPEKDFERLIGAYFHPPENLLPDHVQYLIRLVQEYLEFFKEEIRQGEPPAFDDPKYAEFCDRITALPPAAV